MVTDGPYGADESSIRRTGSSVAAQESSGRIAPDLAERFAFASLRRGVTEFVGLVNDPDFVGPSALTLAVEPTVEGLAKFDSMFFGLNAALINVEHKMALLANVDDYSILVAPGSFVADFEPDPEAALRAFRAFVRQQDPRLRPVASKALARFKRYRTP
jgi:hypothetical protein